jgi:hypothetical protein
MNNNIKQVHNIECKYDIEYSPVEYVNNKYVHNKCNICKKVMHITQSHYINKKNRKAPIICDICYNASRYNGLIGAYKLHYRGPSRLTIFCKYFLNICKINNFQKIKPV